MVRLLVVVVVAGCNLVPVKPDKACQDKLNACYAQCPPQRPDLQPESDNDARTECEKACQLSHGTCD